MLKCLERNVVPLIRFSFVNHVINEVSAEDHPEPPANDNDEVEARRDPASFLGDSEDHCGLRHRLFLHLADAALQFGSRGGRAEHLNAVASAGLALGKLERTDDAAQQRRKLLTGRSNLNWLGQEVEPEEERSAIALGLCRNPRPSRFEKKW